MPHQSTTLDSTYLTLLDSVDAVIYVADIQTYELLFMNKMARETSGGSLGGKCWETLQADQTGPCAFCTNDRLLDKNGNPKAPYVWEFQNTLNKQWYECRDQAVIWPDGRIVRMEIASNITERKLAEESLRESEERLELTLKGAELGAWDWNPISGETVFNNRWAEMLGYQLDEIDQNVDAWSKLLHPDDIPQTMKRVNDHLDGNSPSYQTEFRMRTKTGDWRWILDTGKVTARDKQGKPLRMVGTHQDITERKQAEEALQESEENLRTTLNSIGDAVIAADIQHKIVRINPIAEQLTGWTANEALGKSLLEVFNIVNAKTRQTAENPVEKVLKAGKVVGLANHTILIAKNGRELQIADSAAPIHDNNNQVTGVVLVFRDVTEEYQIREELQKMQQLEKIGTLAGGIAHDFNNILSGIFGNIAMAKRRAEDDHPCMKYLDQAEVSANRAKNLTRKLLTFAKGGEPIKDYVSLGELIKEVVEFDLSGSNIKLIFEKDDDLWAAKVDKGQIQQVFSNLVINASQAMPKGGHLYIKLQNREHTDDPASQIRSGKYVQATLRDEGAGIDDKYLPRIFDPYFSTKQTGRGLGLATVNSIINKHGGHINVVSKKGQGTTFTLCFPAEDEKPTTESTYNNEDTILEGQSIKVLLMDDEETIRSLTTQMLTILGCTAEATTDGEEATKMYRQTMEAGSPYDLVILDLTIPGGMGGKDAIKNILAIDPDAKVVVSSGYADDPVMAHYTEYGFKGVATKPYTMAELKIVIEKALRG